MIKEDEILTLSDDKQYYVLDSIVYNNLNYIMISEYDEKNMKILYNTKIMLNDYQRNTLEKVIDPKTLYVLVNLFNEKDGTLI